MSIEPKHIVRLFTRLAHLYGHKWTSTYGDAMRDGDMTAAAKHWLVDLAAYTPEQIGFGLAMVVEKRPEWPPSPLVFMDLCDGVPTVAEVLDRRNDYGPVCAAVRARLDWYSLEGMSSAQMRHEAEHQREMAVRGLRREGTIARLSLTAASPASNQIAGRCDLALPQQESANAA